MPKFHILSIMGGGIRGLLTAALIQRLEPLKLIENAELISGTSVGGIIALGLAAKIPTSDIVNLFHKHGADIFDASWTRDLLDMGGLLGCKYANDKLKALLIKYFGESKLKDLPKNVLIPTFNFHIPNPSRSEPVFMHNMVDGDGEISVVEAALRTSAAPYYFESIGTFIDGGVICNSPEMAAVAQAIHMGIKIEEIVILSLGTGMKNSFISGSFLDWGAAHWSLPLIQILLDGNSSVAEIQCRQILKDRYFRLNPELPAGSNIALDDYERVDELLDIGNKADITAATAWMQQYWL